MEQAETPILKVTGITKRSLGVLALGNVSLEVPRAVVYGVVGENGAGKSTLREIAGLSQDHSAYADADAGEDC